MQYYTKVNLQKLIEYDDNSIKTNILLKNNDSMVILAAIKKGQTLPEHVTPVNALLYVLDGEVEFSTRDNSCNISAHEVFLIEPNVIHKVYGKKDSKFLVIRI